MKIVIHKWLPNDTQKYYELHATNIVSQWLFCGNLLSVVEVDNASYA